MENNDGSLLRSIVLSEVMQERGSVEQRRRRFAQSIAKARKQNQKKSAASSASKDFNKRASAMRSVFEATRSTSTTQPSTKPSTKQRTRPATKQRTRPVTQQRTKSTTNPSARSPSRLRVSEEELRMHMTDLFTRRAPEKSEAPSGQGLSLIFKQNLQKSSPKAKRLDIFERKRKMRDVNAIWTLLARIKAKVTNTHKALTLRLNSPLKDLHQEILSELSLAHNGKIHARRDAK